MDAKALLRAQKAGAKVQHPHASYSAAGQLRCVVCAVPGECPRWPLALPPSSSTLPPHRQLRDASCES